MSRRADPYSNRKFSVSTRESSELSVGATPSDTASQSYRRTSIMRKPSISLGHLTTGVIAARRFSTFRRPSMVSTALSEHSATTASGPIIKLENTYKLCPLDGEKFNSSRVENVLNSILESFLSGETYDKHKCPQMAKSLSDVIKTRVKEMNFPRYKIICHVAIGQNKCQSITAVSRYLWNAQTDGYASASFKSGSLYALATVYAIYLD